MGARGTVISLAVTTMSTILDAAQSADTAFSEIPIMSVLALVKRIYSRTETLACLKRPRRRYL